MQKSILGYYNPPNFITYLRLVNKMEQVKTYKKTSYNLLEITRANNILDVGCGNGYDCGMFAKICKVDTHILGIDMSSTMIKEANKKKAYSNIQFKRKKIEEMQEENIFDAIYAERIFQHLEKPQSIMCKIFGLLHEGGRAVIADTNWASLNIQGIPQQDAFLLKKIFLDFITNPSLTGEIKKLMEEAGFSKDNITIKRIMLSFKGLKEVGTILWLEDIIKLGRKIGAISALEKNQLFNNINASDPRKIRATFDFYIIRGIK